MTFPIDFEDLSEFFPLSFEDLSILLAITAISLLIMSEVLYPYFGFKVLINTKRLRRVAVFFSILFLVTVSIRVINIISPLY
jgi:hypothetical protein